MKKSVYDELDILEDAASMGEEMDSSHERTLGQLKEELSSMDDTLMEAVEDLENYIEKYHNDTLAVSELAEIFEELLPDIIETMAKTRERLY